MPDVLEHFVEHFVGVIFCFEIAEVCLDVFVDLLHFISILLEQISCISLELICKHELGIAPKQLFEELLVRKSHLVAQSDDVFFRFGFFIGG